MTQPLRLHIRHASRYRYSEPGSGSQLIQALRLTPPSSPSQRVLRWALNAPGIDAATTYTDAFGNTVHLLSSRAAGDAVDIIAEGEVETTDTGGVLGMTGEAVAAGIFLRRTPATAPSDAIRTMAQAARGEDALATMHALMAAVEAHLTYLPDSTDSRTTAAEAFAAGRGVCQDHAHVLLAAARHLAIPARYVSGYLLLDSNAEAAAHHAWVEAHVGALGWVGFDAANLICPTDCYVRLTVGLDAASAAPIRGIRRGAGAERLAVEVAVQRASQQ